MIYAQFWHRGTTGKLIPACGSDSILHLDGRLNETSRHDRALNLMAQPFYARKFEAFTIHKGESYSRSRPLSKLPVNHSGHVSANEVSEAYLINGRVSCNA